MSDKDDTPAVADLLREMVAEVKGLREGLDRNNSAIDELRTGLDRNNSAIDELRTGLGRNTEAVDELRGQVDHLRADTKGLRADVIAARDEARDYLVDIMGELRQIRGRRHTGT